MNNLPEDIQEVWGSKQFRLEYFIAQFTKRIMPLTRHGNYPFPGLTPISKFARVMIKSWLHDGAELLMEYFSLGKEYDDLIKKYKAEN